VKMVFIRFLQWFSLKGITLQKVVKITSFLLLGLGGGVLLLEILGLHLNAGAAGAAAVSMAGWLLLIPFLYNLKLKQYFVISLLQILLLIGFYLVLTSSSVMSTAVLYGGLGGLIWIYKEERRSNSEYKICAGDVLFGASVMLLVGLTLAQIKGERITVGVLGTVIIWVFNGLTHFFSWHGLQEFATLVNQNLVFEYYLYAVLSVLFFAKNDSARGYIKTSWAGWFLGIVGLLLLSVTLVEMLFIRVQGVDVGVHLFTHLLFVLASVLLIYLGNSINKT